MTKESETKGVVPHAPPLAPHLVTSNGKGSIDFYERAFGAKVLFRNDAPDGRVLHASLVLPNGGVFMLHDSFPDMGGVSRTPEALGGTPVTLNVDLPDVDATWKQAVAAGAKEVMPLQDQFWGDRYGVIEDPFGFRWALSTRKHNATQGDVNDATKKLFPAKP